jgi:3-phosphoshikimate 1-carboxyvinyltransferase
MDKIIKPAHKLRGRMTLPGDKSICHRASILGALVKGDTIITNPSPSQEFKYTLECLSQFGVNWEYNEAGNLVIHGQGIEGLKKPESVVNAGDSSVTARLLMGLAAGCPFETQFDGSPKLRAQPMLRVIEPLQKMGAEIECENNRLPVRIKGGNLKAERYIMPLSNSQVKGAVFLAGLNADGTTELIERFQSRDHMERLLNFMSVRFSKEKFKPPAPKIADEFERRLKKAKGIVDDQRGDMFKLPGRQLPAAGLTIEVPGDLSAAAMFVAAGVLARGSDIKIDNIGLNPTRRGFLEILSKMRANLKFEVGVMKNNEPFGAISASYGPLKGRRIVGEMIPTIIDELPLMAVIATQAQGTTVIRDAFELRSKETDRIKAVVTNLRKMGARIGELEDGMAIDGGTALEGAEISSYGDHRIAMAFTIAGLVAKGETVIKDAECVATSYPSFWVDLDSMIQH